MTLPEWIRESVRADADADLFSQWWRSTVLDKGSAEPLISVAVFDELHHTADLTAAFPIGNAGLLHTYGYLLSTTATSRGMKRDRWLDGKLATALGFADDAFRPGTAGGTVLARVTAAALPVLLDPPADALLIDEGPVGQLQTRVVLLRPAGASTHAVVYGVDDGTGYRLVTAFAMEGQNDDLLDDILENPRRMRWNAAP